MSRAAASASNIDPNPQTYGDLKSPPSSEIDYSSAQSITEIWATAAERFGSVVAVNDPHGTPKLVHTYADLYQEIQRFAAGLQSLGVVAGDRVALFSDNSPRWLIADQGIMMAGAADAVRSSQTDRDELAFILRNSGSTVLVAQDLQTFKKLRGSLAELAIQRVILLSDEQPDSSDQANQEFKIFNYRQIQELGSEHSLTPVSQGRDALATLIYTSGTTGQPKGVMLSHGNLLAQIIAVPYVIIPSAGERVLSLLPSWHSYERTFEYFIFAYGCTQIYTNIRHIKQDLKTFKPHYMVGVPRIWDSIYEGVQKQFREQPPRKQQLVQFFLNTSHRFVKARRIVQKLDLQNRNPNVVERGVAGMQAIALFPIHAIANQIVYRKIREATGGSVKLLVSGGGSLAKHLDDFYEVIGVTILQGYGLTETSPITNVRRLEHNLRGSSGPPIPYTDVQIVDPETYQLLPVGQKGLIRVRGPQIMQGYYQNPEATEKVLSADGWFNTGDLGWMTKENDLTITGRAKDTIVLTSGENIEPQPIEDACVRSAYIDQIMLVGQDQKSLGALVVPNLDALEKWAKNQNLSLQLDDHSPANDSTADDSVSKTIGLNSPETYQLFRQELNREVKDRPGYRPDDRIGPFCLISEPFSTENGMLTQTLKVRRPVVMERYRGMIDGMFT
ncbi:MAG: AMP-dependent synthetase/ligase [Elainellaceae cyanobacterium]